MKTAFGLVEIKDDLDKLRLQIAVCGGNAEADRNQAAYDIQIPMACLRACIDIIPAEAMLVKSLEEELVMNVLLVPAGRVKEGGPLMGYLLPAMEGNKVVTGVMTGVFTSIKNAFDLAFCFPATGNYTAYVDDSVLRNGSAAWPLQETESHGGAQKYFTLTKDGNTVKMELSS